MISVIPAIDIIEGKCVRLTEGDYSRVSVYSNDPVAVAKSFRDAGITRLHLVDLDGAKSGTTKNLHVLEQIAAKADLVIDFGGGVKTSSGLDSVISAGATFVTVGSFAVKEPAQFNDWVAKYGAEKFFIGADVRGEKIAVNGWLEQTELDVIDFVHDLMSKRVHYFFCTDIAKDGMLQGPSLDLYRHIIAKCPGIRLVASGGVSSVSDIEMLDATGCESVIVGKAFYEGRISLEQISRFNSASN